MLNYAGEAGEAGDDPQRSTTFARLARGARRNVEMEARAANHGNYVIGRGWRCDSDEAGDGN